MSANTVEHRGNKRYNVKECLVQYKPGSILDIFSSASPEYIVLDISQTGMQFITCERFKEKTTLLLKINASCLKGEMIYTRGYIVWIKDAPKLGIYVVGVKFVSMSEQDQGRLKDILDNAVINKVKISDLVFLKKADKLRPASKKLRI